MKNSILQTILFSSLVILSLAISSFTLKHIVGNKEPKKETATTSQPNTSHDGFAVLELFTSQGCSSCPPADEVLSKYATLNNPAIFPLAFHVDYWNYLGWKDPFSKAQFSERQRHYANVMNSQGNYTPQLIINGKHELVGSKENLINDIVMQELAIKKQNTISITKATLNDNQINIEYALESTTPNTVVNLALIKKEEFTSIRRGENSGLKQTSYNIVFDFKTVYNVSNSDSFKFNKEWLSTDFIIVAYLQNIKTGEILIATKSEIK
jgi:hypothetical protein